MALYPNDKPASISDNIYNFIATGNRTMPDGARQTAGFLPGAGLPAQHLNALQYANSQWITFLDTFVEKYDRSVGVVAVGSTNNVGDFNTSIGVEAGGSSIGTEGVFSGYKAGATNGATTTDSTFVGAFAGNNNSFSGSFFKNTAVGRSAMSRATGNTTTAVGYSSGEDSNSYDSVFMGANSAVNSDGNEVVAIGFNAGYRATYSADLNLRDSVMIGSNAASFSGFSRFSVVLGNNAMTQTTGFDNSVAIGYASGYQHIDGSGMVAIGAYSAYTGVGQYSTNLGYFTGNTNQANTEFSTFVGHESGYAAAFSGSFNYNTAIGSQTLKDSEVTYTLSAGRRAGWKAKGLNSVYLGESSGTFTGARTALSVDEVFAGKDSGKDIVCSGITTPISTALYQVAVGSGALSSLSVSTTSSGNPVISDNVAIGKDSMKSITATAATSTNVSGNVAVGSGSLTSSTGGASGQLKFNTAIGFNSQQSSTGGVNNSSLGAYSLTNSTSTYTVAVGANSGGSSSGISSVYVGNGSGVSYSGDYSILIGNSAGVNNSGDDIIAIGQEAYTDTLASGTHTVGDGSIFIGKYQGRDITTTTDIVYRVGHLQTAPYLEGRMLTTSGDSPATAGFLKFQTCIILRNTNGAIFSGSGTEGAMLYDDVNKKLRFYDGTSWKTVTST